MKYTIVLTSLAISLILYVINFANSENILTQKVSSELPRFLQTGIILNNISQDKTDHQTKTWAVNAYGRLPLGFEANQGQTEPKVKYFCRGSGYTLFLTQEEAVFCLKKDSKETKSPINRIPLTRADQLIIQMKPIGANPKVKIMGEDELYGKINHFKGNDPKKWQTNVAQYRRVRYKDVYPGIDLIYYGNQGQWEYDFVINPGADPKKIRIQFKGTDKITIDDNGDLILHTEMGKIHQHKPMLYQEIEGKQQFIKGKYILEGKDKVRFEVGKYDIKKQLIIDPILIYSTYLGGVSAEYFHDITIDNTGSIYITGTTDSYDFPYTWSGKKDSKYSANDIFVTKIDKGGTQILYSSLIGGSNYDVGMGIAVDKLGDAYITGSTLSSDFPLKNAIQNVIVQFGDAFITKINSTGNAIIYSTYIGGSSAYEDIGKSIAVDFMGCAYITGRTYSTDYPTTAGSIMPTSNTLPYGPSTSDGFVTKINPSGTAIVYSTYLGEEGYKDECSDIVVDSVGNAYISGYTNSKNFPGAKKSKIQPLLGGNGDGFVIKINRDGSAVIFSTYLGGKDSDYCAGITLDLMNNIYVTGSTGSDNFPTTSGSYLPSQKSLFGYGTGFITKIDASGNQLIYSTYIAEEGACLGIALDSKYNVYVSGTTWSNNFVTTPNAAQSIYGGAGIFFWGDAFLAKLDSNGKNLLYATYLGGSEDDEGTRVAVDINNEVYVAGTTSSINFPVTGNAIQNNNAGPFDTFITKVGFIIITLYPKNLADGQEGVYYNENIIASGGTAPYTYIVSKGYLPPGLKLSSHGVIKGVPMVAGKYSFTISATDTDGYVGSRDYGITIKYKDNPYYTEHKTPNTNVMRVHKYIYNGDPDFFPGPGPVQPLAIKDGIEKNIRSGVRTYKK